MRGELASVLQVEPGRIDCAATFNAQGLDSLGAIALVRRLSERIDRKLSPTLIWRYPSVSALAAQLDPARAEASAGPQEGTLPSAEPIAIVGMASRFPGAGSLDALWAMLREGRDAIREVPRDRWDAAALCASDPGDGRLRSARFGGFIEQVDGFDSLFFGISPREAIQMDPQQRLMLELSWEALEDTGVALGPARHAGVFFGVVFSDYERLREALGLGGVTQHTSTGSVQAIIANRVSYALDLQGPSLIVNTACSSSLVAVHLACQSLRAGECTLALAGGVHLMLGPETTLAVASVGALSPDGRCWTFDARANGYVRGEGGGVVVLKPLSLALRDADRIYAIIAGSGVNNDGASNGLTAPNPAAQEAVLREAYRRAGVDPATVDYVELHGTGTALGDPIEASVLGAVVGAGRSAEHPLLVGSIKTNIGHLEAAAGMAGLIKVASSLHRQTIPPSLNFSQPNPEIDLEALRLRVVTAAQRWPSSAGRPARAGVSSFGFGGTNAHLLLEEAPRAARLFALAAGTQEQLARAAGEARAWLSREAADLPLEALGAELAPPPEGPYRAAMVASSREELEAALEALASGSERPEVMAGRAEPGAPGPVFVFSGLGSQWIGMGRRLYTEEPTFREALMACDAVLQQEAGWSPIEVLWAARPERPLDDPDAHDVLNPLLVALQVATAALWRSWGIEPAAVIGHSIGEIAAAHVAGALDLREAMRAILGVGKIYRRAVLEGGGLLGLVSVAPDALEELLGPRAPGVSVVGSNDPRTTLLCGPAGEVGGVLRALEQRGVFCRELSRVWAHCPRVEPLAAELVEQLGELAPRPVRIPMISTTLGRAVAGTELGVEHWRANVTQPVLFARGVELLLREGHRCFLELSPHAILLKSIQRSARAAGATVVALPSQLAEQDGHATILGSLGQLFTKGARIRWEALFAAPRRGGEGKGSPEELGASFLLPFSARSAVSLQRLAAAHAERLRVARVDGRHGPGLFRYCQAAARRRTHHPFRAWAVAPTAALLVEKLEALSRAPVRPPSGVPPRTLFVFSGNGSQRPGMMLQLAVEQPVIRDVLGECDALLQRLAGWSLLHELAEPPERSRLDRHEYAHPAQVAVQLSLHALWRSFGVEPDLLVGHSVGEISAAAAAGAFDLETALRLAVLRGRLMERPEASGRMAQVWLPAAEVERLLKEAGSAAAIGAINGPRSTVITGSPDAVEAAIRDLYRAGAQCGRLPLKVAAHSASIGPLGEEMAREAASWLRPRSLERPLLSTRTGARIDGQDLDAGYWGRQFREPVAFEAAFAAALEDGVELVVEVSPHPVLGQEMVEAVELGGSRAEVLASLRKGTSEPTALRETLAAAWARGAPVRWEAVFPGSPLHVDLPTYPWNRQRCWLPPPRRERPAGVHPLLGEHLALAGRPGEHVFSTTVSLEDLPFLADHRVQGSVVFPAAAYVEMAVGAARAVLGKGAVEVRDLELQSPLILEPQQPAALQLTLSLNGPAAGFQVHARAAPPGAADGKGEPWTAVAQGTVRVDEGT